MSQIDDGGPAFPQLKRLRNDSGPSTILYDAETVGGMTLRDWFAGQALAGWVSVSPAIGGEELNGTYPHGEKIAATAYRYADAMLAARKVKP